jgi:hypothetical protein
MSNCYDLTRVQRGKVGSNTTRDLFSLGKDGGDTGILRSKIEELGNVRLVVIDPLQAVATSTIAFNQQARLHIIRPLQELAYDTGVTILICHHFNKGVTIDNMIDRVNGSKGLLDAVRVTNVIVRHPDNPEVRVLLTLKGNMTMSAEPVAFRISGSGRDTHLEFKAPPPSTEDRETLLAYIVVTLREAERPMSAQEIAATCRIPFSLAKQLLYEGMELNMIKYERKAFSVPKMLTGVPAPIMNELVKQSGLSDLEVIT